MLKNQGCLSFFFYNFLSGIIEKNTGSAHDHKVTVAIC